MGARIQRFERRVALALASGALGVTLLAAPATAKNDQIVYMDGRTVTGVEILKETIEEVRVKQLGNLRAREVLRLIHGNPPTSYGKGEAAYFAGQYEAAVSSFQSAYSEGGEEWVKPYALYYEAESLRKWGGVSADKGKLSRAADKYRSFISEFPDHFLLGAVRWGLGDALLQAGNASEAQSEFAQVADRKYGDYWELWGKLGKGSCALEQQDYSAARAEIEIVMSNANRPGFSELMATAKVMLGETFMARKDYDRAIDYYEDMARKGEGQGSQAAAGAFVNLARAYRARNKNDDKRRALKTYLAVTIYYAGALEAYAEALYSAGELLDEKGEKEQAKAYYRELKARCKGTSWARKAP